MATPSQTTTQQEVIRRQNKGPPIKFLVPLVYAPVLPLIRLTLRHRPVLRDRLFTAVLAGAFAHGFYLVNMLPMPSQPTLTSVGNSLLLRHSACILFGILLVSLMFMSRTDIYDAESK